MTNKSDVIDADLELEQGMVDVDEDEAEDTMSAVYEVGYHLLPTLSEESLAGVVSNITDALKAMSADFIGERFPSKINLAYPISKKIGERKDYFDSAYFGWIAFEIPKASLQSVQTLFETHASVARYLVIRTDRNAVAALMTGAVASPAGDIGKPKREEEQGGALSEKALDEALQTIEAEDAKVSE